jgi:hypothetical protein
MPIVIKLTIPPYAPMKHGSAFNKRSQNRGKPKLKGSALLNVSAHNTTQDLIEEIQAKSPQLTRAQL